MIKVVVSGAAGKMGQEVCRAVLDDAELDLVGAVDINCAEGEIDIGSIIGRGITKILVTNDLKDTINNTSPSVVVDFTHPSAVMDNIKKIIEAGVDGVIGTTGITPEDLLAIEQLLKNSESHIFIAPNFAIGAVLMTYLAQKAAKYLDAVEIIELHHDAKADAPSGTAISTAKKLSESIENIKVSKSKESYSGARGADIGDVRVHSIRLPGFVAHQEVIFGAKGQTLTIRHDSIDRTSFMPGVVSAVKAVRTLPPLTIGLENLLGLNL